MPCRHSSFVGHDGRGQGQPGMSRPAGVVTMPLRGVGPTLPRHAGVGAVPPARLPPHLPLADIHR